MKEKWLVGSEGKRKRGHWTGFLGGTSCEFKASQENAVIYEYIQASLEILDLSGRRDRSGTNCQPHATLRESLGMSYVSNNHAYRAKFI